MNYIKVNREWKIAYSYLVFGVIMLLAYIFTHEYELAVVSELIFIAVYFIHSFLYYNIKYTLKFFGVTYILALGIEEIGLHSGIPFGHYYYTAVLGPKIFGVPLAIPFLWSSLLYFTLIAADNNIFKAAFLMMLLDLSFDPRFSMHIWHWVTPGIYFGVPLINFIGWFISSLIIYYVISKIICKKDNYDINGIIFYGMFGIFQGIEDIVVGLFLLSFISFAMFMLAIYFLLASYNHKIRQKPLKIY
ncbi:MAG: carotenoid biosynthesis protein [Ferroplasma sp.]